MAKKDKYFLTFSILFTITVTILIFLSSNNRKNIVFGSSVALSGPLKEIGIEYITGVQSYFMHINENRLLRDKRVFLKVYDDKYEPHITYQNITKLIYSEPNLLGVLGVLGTPTSEVALTQSLKSKIPFLMPFSGASFLYNESKRVFMFRPSYFDETLKIVEYLKSKNIDKIAIFYQNDSYGISALNSLQRALNNIDIKILAEGVYSRNTISIHSAYEEIVKSKPEAVIVAGSYKPTIEFIKKAYRDNSNWLIFNLSFVGLEQLSNIDKKYLARENIFITQPLKPLEFKSENEKNFQTIYSKYFPKQKLTSTAYEGFLVAQIIIENLQNINYISTERFLKEIESFSKKIDYLDISYSKDKHTALDNLYLINLKRDSYKVLK